MSMPHPPPRRSALLSSLLLALAASTLAPGLAAQRYELRAPDGATALVVVVDDSVTYALHHRDVVRVAPSPVSLTLGDGTVLGSGAAVLEARRGEGDRVLRPVVPEKRSQVVDRYNELHLAFHGGWALRFRAYDDGAAYRFETDLGDSLVVRDERATFRVAGARELIVAEEEGFVTHSEQNYTRLPPDAFSAERLATVPLVAAYPDGTKLALTEAGLEDYAGMSVRGDPGGGLAGAFPRVALAEAPTSPDPRALRNLYPTERADYIARTRGERAFPWRVFVVADRDGDLIESDMVYRLAPELRLEDTDWIRPGKVAWDWYNANNLFGVDFVAGVNTETYRYYIDFAAEHGLEYVILDEGWYRLGDLLDVNPDIDVEALMAYARERGVGLILWVVWSTLDRQMEEALDRFQAWGAKGIKVDFMQRDDQAAVDFYWRTAREAAQRHLLVDFHGSYKPTGIRRAYPNVLTREGVKGGEHNKWSADATPEHNVTLPFIRMLAGPMDYTPGAMENAQPDNFNPVFTRPMSLGTRVHQLAMYVVFESPLQMLADSPSRYLREPEVMDFLGPVPTVWDETRVLDAVLGDYVVVARRSGAEWWIGAMTDGDPRTLEVELDLPGAGSWSMDAWRDGPNAARYASDYRREATTVGSGETLRIDMAPGGGFAARLVPR